MTSSKSSDDRVVGAQTVLRALSVLSLLRRAQGDVGVTEIARQLGLRTSTAHRLLQALLSAGFASQNPQNDRYRLGRESLLLGVGAERTLGFTAAMPLLEQLSEQFGESANLVVRDGQHGLVVLRVDSPQPLRFSQPTGSQIPLHCTSSGKALLAFAGDPEDEVRQLGRLQRLTTRTVTSPSTLLRQLLQIRTDGYAINEGERHPGVSGVAAPVFGPAGDVLVVIALQGPETRLPTKRLHELGSHLVESSREIATILPAASSGLLA